MFENSNDTKLWPHNVSSRYYPTETRISTLSSDRLKLRSERYDEEEWVEIAYERNQIHFNDHWLYDKADLPYDFINYKKKRTAYYDGYNNKSLKYSSTK